MEPAGKAHVFVADVEQPVFDDHDRRHLERALRLRSGDLLTVSDGAGRWRLARFGPAVEPVGPVEVDDGPTPEITIAFALVKGGRPELVVQKLTEIGVDRIVPFVAERSVVQWDDDRAARNYARLVTIAREAGMQSRRSWLPAVEPVTTFASVATRPGAALADRAGDRPGLGWPCLLVGPEGGWADSEREAGLPAIGLGGTVLRAETAAIVAGAVLCGLRSLLFAPVDRHGG